jgi:hypothetical protein
MPGIDLLISRDLSAEFKIKLKNTLLKKLEHQLFLEEGMSIKLSMEHFEKFHNILKRHASFNLETFEKDCIKKIFQVNKINNNYNVKLINQNLAEKIFNYYGDSESRKILMSVMGEALTVPEILTKSLVLKSPAYRKIENLLLDGLIIESGKILKHTKRITKYVCIFDKINIHVNNNQISVEGIISSAKFNESSITNTGLFEK